MKRGITSERRAWRSSLGRVEGTLGVVAACWVGAFGAVAEVGLELRVPEAQVQETHVLGDATPLIWKFTNRGPQPLGFMWEGCCRLNGRLTVTQSGTVVDGVPPSQALAHMFAKADRLEPGAPREYETRVSDWVRLPGTGTYQLQGFYRGVLSNQFPQLQRGLALWRDAAESAPITVSVVSVDDYLAQRSEREKRRGLSLALSEDSRLSAMKPATLSLVISNALPDPVSLRWPDEFALWIVDANGRRIAPSVVLDDSPAAWVIPGRSAARREFQVAPDRMEGEPLGEHRLFVDLMGSGPKVPRVPSAAREFPWRLEPQDVLELVESAARGAGTGARNAPLKMLRVYCGELAEALAQASRGAGSLEARTLAARLHVASRLKPVAPVPGLVKLGVRRTPDGRWSWVDPRVGQALESGDWTSQWDQVMAVRRDLGWDVQLELLPDDSVDVASLVPELLGLRSKAAAAGHPLLSGVREASQGVAPVQVVWAEGTRAMGGWVLMIGETEWAVAVNQGNDPSRSTTRGTEMAELVRTLAGTAQALGSAEVTLVVEPGVSWGRIRTLLETASPPGIRWHLSARFAEPQE